MIKRIWKKKWVRRVIIGLIVFPIILFTVLISIVYWKQDAIVQELLATANEDFHGKITLKDSHVSPFANFPYISIDLEDLRVFESKEPGANEILHIGDTYIGFNIWSIVAGDFTIRQVRASNGTIDLVQHTDGSLNILKALETTKEIEDAEEEFHIDLKKIRLDDIEITKLNEENGIKIDALVSEANANFKSVKDQVNAGLDIHFVLNVLKNGDTTFFKHKQVDFSSDVHYKSLEQMLLIDPTEVEIEGANFAMEGEIDVKNEMDLDLKFKGDKPNFDMFIAMAPEDLIPVLQTYENRGQIYFNARVSGKSINGHQPAIRADFGCKNGFFENKHFKRKLEQLQFKGYFTNGSKRSPETMEFGIQNFESKPEIGKFNVDITVKNFNSPEINLVVDSDIELNYLREFLDLEEVSMARGRVRFSMNFNDIIDFSAPEKMIKKFNESYAMGLSCTNVSIESTLIPFPIRSLSLDSELNGHELSLKRFSVKTPESSVSIRGLISDLPAILHHTKEVITAELHISSPKISTAEFLPQENGKNEVITDLKMDLRFLSSAKNMTEFKLIPEGEFLIDNFHARLKHYRHAFHDFTADLISKEDEIILKKFHGEIDKSDFNLTATLKNLHILTDAHPSGNIEVDYNFTSDRLQLHDLLTYRSETLLPEEYRHEEFDHLKVHAKTLLTYQETLRSTDTYFDHLTADMKVHPVKLQNLKGRVHTEKDHFVIDDLSGNIGKTDFHTTLHYYYGDETAKRKNKLVFRAGFLDVDQLLSYAPASEQTASTTKGENYHDQGFNIYTLPFSDMSFDLNIDQLNYHKYKLSAIQGKLRTTPDHYIHIDHLGLNAAGGHFEIKGYFNGSNPKKIYFSPVIKATNVDLDQLLLKFDNFGQDHLVSENLHGRFTGKISGKIHVHKDLVPIIDDSEIHLDLKVINGRLENFALLASMSDYFKDKNLKKVMFDTLQNHIDLVNGKMTIPEMDINSSLGHLIISGEQDLSMNMDYVVKVPLKLVTGVAKSKLFGRDQEIDPEQVDEIQYGTEKTAYITIRITGTSDDYSISLSKKKKKGKS